MISLVIIWLIELQKLHKICNKLTQEQLHLSMIKKYIKKFFVYLQKKGKKLLIV